LPLTPESLRRILVVRLSSLGDVVRVAGVLQALKDAAPRAAITLVTGRGPAPLLAGHPAVERVIVARRPTDRPLAAWWEAWRRLGPLRHGGGIDLALDLQGSEASARWAKASGAAVRARRGGPGRGWAASVAPDMRRPDAAESYLLLRQLGLALAPRAPRLHVNPAADATVAALLAAHGLPARGYILVSPCSLWPAKDWPAASYARLLPALAVASGRPILLSTGREAAAKAALAELQALSPAPLPAVAGELRIDGLMALIARAGLLISGDSGPMHMAAALGVPQVALFGPTWPERAGPDGWDRPGSRIRLLQRQRCADYHAYRAAANQAATAAIPVGEVLSAALELLALAPAESAA
jgi:ADP-heptose:LPS heptosyltransferase